MTAEYFLTVQIGVTSLRLEWENEYLDEFYSELNYIFDVECGTVQSYEENFEDIKSELDSESGKVDEISNLCRRYRGDDL